MVADEGEEAAAGFEGSGLADEAVDSDSDGRAGKRFEGFFLKAGLGEPTSNRWGQVRAPTMPSPDHGRTGAAQGRQRGHGGLDVAVADVAEHAARKDDCRWSDAYISVRDPGITLHHLDAR